MSGWRWRESPKPGRKPKVDGRRSRQRQPIDHLEPGPFPIGTVEATIVHTPGHTPGHVSIHIASEGEEAVITGDMIHHPCQIAHADSPRSVDPFR